MVKVTYSHYIKLSDRIENPFIVCVQKTPLLFLLAVLVVLVVTSYSTIYFTTSTITRSSGCYSKRCWWYMVGTAIFPEKEKLFNKMIRHIPTIHSFFLFLSVYLHVCHGSTIHTRSEYSSSYKKIVLNVFFTEGNDDSRKKLHSSSYFFWFGLL